MQPFERTQVSRTVNRSSGTDGHHLRVDGGSTRRSASHRARLRETKNPETRRAAAGATLRVEATVTPRSAVWSVGSITACSSTVDILSSAPLPTHTGHVVVRPTENARPVTVRGCQRTVRVPRSGDSRKRYGSDTNVARVNSSQRGVGSPIQVENIIIGC